MGGMLFDEKTDSFRSLRRFHLRRGLLRADRIIAVSSSTRRDIHNIVGVPEKEVRVVYKMCIRDRCRTVHGSRKSRAAG